MAKSDNMVKYTALDRLRQKPADLAATSFADLMKVVDPADVKDAAEALGNGFTVASQKDKDSLVNVPFVIIDWRINPNGRFGSFATLFIKTVDNRNLILNDGGSGIPDQLEELKANNFTGIIQCRHGLSVATYPAFEYQYDNDGNAVRDDEGNHVRRPLMDPATGQQVTGKTYRLNLSD